MEIQTFILAAKIDSRSGNRYDVQHAAMHQMEFSQKWSFPVRLTIPALLVLRRELAAEEEESFCLHFNLVDEDGRSVGQPSNYPFEGTFPAGKRFAFGLLRMAFEFPSPGQYRLDISTDDGLSESIFSYGIDITRPPAPEEAGSDESGGEALGWDE